jgi:hypothetical protein
MGHSAIAEHVIKTSVLEACTRHGIPHDSALRQQLESEAEIPANSRAFRFNGSIPKLKAGTHGINLIQPVLE